MVINSKNKEGYGLLYDAEIKAYRYAAEQINKYVALCCDFTFDEYNPTKKNFISIGDNEKSKELIRQADKAALKHNGFRIVFKDGNIYIFGGDKLGTVYGAFEFIERYLGVRFLTSVVELTPKAEALQIDERDVQMKPCFEQRECCTFSYMINPDFALKRRFESVHAPNYPEIGLTMNRWYRGMPTGHTSHLYVPKSKYLKEHREMFATLNPNYNFKFGYCNAEGESSLECCYSNGLNEDGSVDEALEVSTVKVVAESLYRYIKMAPDKEFFMFGRQDGGGVCHCSRCLNKREKYGGEAGTMIIFLNAVIDLVEKRLQAEGTEPKFSVVTFAYGATLQAPVDKEFNAIGKEVIPNKRLYIRFAPLGGNGGLRHDDPKNEKSYAAIKGWTAITENFMFYDYPVQYSNEFFLFPIYLHLAEDIRYFSKLGVKYVMYEEAYAGTEPYHIEMDSYVMSKLFWNPDLNAFDLMKEFCDGYYGVAGGYVYEFRRKLLAHYKTLVEKGVVLQPLGLTSEILKAENNPKELLIECVDLLDKGLREIEQSNLSFGKKKALEKRVKYALLSPLGMIAHNREFYFESGKSIYQNRFESTMKEIEFPIREIEVVSGTDTAYKILTDKENGQFMQAAQFIQEWIKNKSGISLEIIGQYDAYPTGSTKVISVGANDYAKEFFKDTSFEEYRLFLKTAVNSIFVAGTNLDDAGQIFVDKLHTRVWFENNDTVACTQLRLDYLDVIDFCKS